MQLIDIWLISLFLWPALGLASQGAHTIQVWAVNVGGPAYRGSEGTVFAAESGVHGGAVGRMETVKGSQDAFIYRTYRVGDVRLQRSLPRGRYDLTFYFAEPDEVGGGARVFDAFAEGRRVIAALDVMAMRDGKVQSALTVTVPDVEVADGQLDIHFEASTGAPVLSAVAVHRKEGVHGAANDGSGAHRPTWRLHWYDEFDGTSLDPEKWNVVTWPARKVNDEDQAYTSRPRNLRVLAGKLVLEAHREDYDDARYTSARVNSSGKGDFLYGRVEVRARLPRGMGTWPAIWMLPSDPFRYATRCGPGTDWQGSGECDAWPNSGEIDIMEHVGYQMGHVHATVHNEAYYWAKWEQRKGRILLDDVDEAYHIYELEWTPERIDAFVDGARYFTYVNEHEGWRSWPYDHPFHLVLNLAVGGAWGRAGGGIDDGIFPQRMLIDYVRVYERVPAVHGAGDGGN
jgi:beta-glucanase (GH16 family)